ncbi:MAG: MucB/RseB C-terminal domain-containing protein [Burkholderiales bacterium]|nr:MucB/RseB C-terminal domain-containing protein [Burkholderiales bacterium]
MRGLFLFVLRVLVFASFAQFSAIAGEVATEQNEAQVLLKKIQAAAQKLNYSGIFVYQEASQMRTSRITHIHDGKNELQKLEMLDGRRREYTKSNDEITCYVPENKTVLVEKRGTQDEFPAIFGANVAELEAHYQVRKSETDRVAGYDCQVLLLEPKDNFRYGYKLWAEKNTGLLLRVQTLNERSEIVEQISFSQLKIGDIDRTQVKSSFGDTNGWRVENASINETALTNWLVKWVPPGFKKTRELRRQVSANSGMLGSAGREVGQIVFSDGLAAISVFIENFNPQRVERAQRQGAMNIIGKRLGDYWLTVVGEVPAVAIRQVANSIEFRPTATK